MVSLVNRPRLTWKGGSVRAHRTLRPCVLRWNARSIRPSPSLLVPGAVRKVKPGALLGGIGHGSQPCVSDDPQRLVHVAAGPAEERRGDQSRTTDTLTTVGDHRPAGTQDRVEAVDEGIEGSPRSGRSAIRDGKRVKHDAVGPAPCFLGREVQLSNLLRRQQRRHIGDAGSAPGLQFIRQPVPASWSRGDGQDAKPRARDSVERGVHVRSPPGRRRAREGAHRRPRLARGVPQSDGARPSSCHHAVPSAHPSGPEEASPGAPGCTRPIRES